MGSKLLKELGSVEGNIHDVNKATFNKPENKKKNREIDVAVMMLFKNIYILKDFITNPVETCRKITTEYADLPYSKEFVELTKAVNCSHTKEQAITLGKGKIIEYINKVKEECGTKYDIINNKVAENVDVINKAQEVVNLSFDADTLSRRYQQATENEYFTKYTVGNVEKIFIPAGIEISPIMQVIRFLQVCQIVYSRNQNDEINYLINSIANIAKDAEGKAAYIVANNNYLYQQQFNKTRFEFSPFAEELVKLGGKSKEDYYKNVIKKEFDNIPADSEEYLILDMVQNMINNTAGKRELLVNKLEELKQAYTIIIDADSKLDLVGVLNKITEDLLEPIDKMTITIEDYSTRADHLRLVIQNMLSIRERTEDLLNAIKLAPNNFVYTIDKIYKLLDKVMVKSTINKGREKEGELIVTNNVLGDTNATK